MRHFRPALLLLTVALCSARAWAQSDPKPIPQRDPPGAITQITLTNPNPTPVPAVVLANCQPGQDCSPTNPCPVINDMQTPLCADFNFQNATGKTLTSITMFFTSDPKFNGSYVFNCPLQSEMTSAVFFDNCSQSPVSNGDVTTGEDITFSADGKNGFDGVAPLAPCPTALSSVSGCSDGLFAIDVYGSDLVSGTSITTQAITTPEPGAGLMVLFSALAFALFQLVRRAV